MPDTSALLRVEQVSYNSTLGSQPLLHDISFDVFAGDRLAVIGASGAGKTTLLRLLNRLNDVSQGNIYLEQQEIRQIPVIQLRQQVTLVPQESRLLGMTVRETLAYPLTLRGLDQATIQQRTATWLEQLHIPTDWLGRSEVQLSVGQRQLVAIARALMVQPKVLLLDEPTSALDAGRASYLLGLLRRLAENQQLTILMINHQLELMPQFCNRVLYLHQGKLLHNLSADQVDWGDLKQTLIRMEDEEAEEWM